jgi:hypothetical protein
MGWRWMDCWGVRQRGSNIGAYIQTGKTSCRSPPVPTDNLQRPLTIAQPDTDQTLQHFGVVGDTYSMTTSDDQTRSRLLLQILISFSQKTMASPSLCSTCFVSSQMADASDISNTSTW